jgi:hypothetical protein
MFLFISNPLNESPLSFPILECIHIIAFALSIGTIAIVDFRLLEIGMVHQTPAQLLKDTSAWTLVGIVIMIFSGLLLFSSDPDMYYLNWAFLIKIACLLLAIVFNYTIHRKAANSETPPANAKFVACVSLMLWGAVIFGGIFIAFINQGLSFRARA